MHKKLTVLALSATLLSLQNLQAQDLAVKSLLLTKGKKWDQLANNKKQLQNNVISVRPFTQFTLKIDGSAKKVTGSYDVTSKLKKAGSCIFTIRNKKGEIFNSGIVKKGTPAQNFSVDISSDKELIFTVYDGGEYGNHYDANWIDLKLEGLSGKITAEQNYFPGADEYAPSRAQYFSWINNTNEGPTAVQTKINLDFFKFLHDQYGMILDIYAFDAGAIDGCNFYGMLDSVRFRQQFPKGFGPLVKYAGKMNTRFGIWGGPDGFGTTKKEANERRKMLVKLARDYNFELFKFDLVCGKLDNIDEFINAMQEVREHDPSLILLNHRLPLKHGTKEATTFLYGGKETYIDVHMENAVTAPHHRAGALMRDLPPNLTRLTEDHGTCISSCPDAWDDDLILQAFNRCLILAPEIYGNPWLLKDSDFPKLARIYNLHRRYRTIMTTGMVLPKSYGMYPVARGSKATRLITLRNASWDDKKITVNLSDEIGLTKTNNNIVARVLHPFEETVKSDLKYGDKFEVTIKPFRSLLLLVSAEKDGHGFALEGAKYNVVREVEDKPLKVDIFGKNGEEKTIKISGFNKKFTKATINKIDYSKLLKGENINVSFKSKASKYHEPNFKVAELKSIDYPADSKSLFEATCFAGSSNALEAQAIEKIGWSKIKQVRKAQNAFFNQPLFAERGIWDKNLFDGKMDTCFYAMYRKLHHKPIIPGIFRVDFGKVYDADQIVVKVPDTFSLQPFMNQEGHIAEISEDLKIWTPVRFLADLDSVIKIPAGKKVRYLRMFTEKKQQPLRIAEVELWKNEGMLPRDNFRASNLFRDITDLNFEKAWSCSFELPKNLAPNSKICVAINGKYGDENAYAALKVTDKKGNISYVGANDRAPSFTYNAWEGNPQVPIKGNYTYYFPVTKNLIGKKIEAVVLGVKECKSMRPEVRVVAPEPLIKKQLIIK
ncbi:NPCBM/NEW2 domain-containing protein [Lentisphaerota bacterium WC36G]|nr:NPCBM/NEW2 domain-containing protein [Lentisphaerae bacterium WC36]